MNKIIFTIFILVSSTVSYSQVLVNLHQPPPFQFKADAMWKVTLNNTGSPVEIYLFGYVTNLDNGQRVVEGTSSKFILQTGSKNVNAQEISPVSLKKYDNSIENTLNRTGTFKAGSYQICVSARSAATNEVLGEDCIFVDVINSTQSELISPENNEEVIGIQPVFTWLGPTGVASTRRITYELAIYPILERQTAYYATISNPAIFVKSDILSVAFQYPLSARPFDNGRRYAWRLRTFIDGSQISESEVRSFTYSNGLTDDEVFTRDISLNKGQSDLSSWLKEKKSEVSGNNFTLRRNGLNFLSSSGANLRNENIDSRFRGNDIIRNRGSLFSDKPFEFKGNYSINGNLQNQQSTGSEAPKNYLGLQFNPTILIYGIPIDASFYFDTRQKDWKQNINSASFLFNPNKLKDMVKEKVEDMKNELIRKKDEMINSLKDQAFGEAEKIKKEYEGKIKAVEKSVPFYLKAFTLFNSFGIGETYPMYSEYTVSGVKVTGLDLEVNPWLLHLHVTGLKNLDKITDSVFARNLYAGSFGVGEKDNSHFHITYMKAYDREASLDLNKIPSSLTPGENTILGLNGKLNFLDNKVSIEGEGGVTVLTRDRLAPKLAPGDIPSIVEDLTNANTSSQYDYMYKVKSNVNIPESKTNVEGEFRLIGPGYISYGAPDISGKGKTGYKIGLEQLLDQDRISFSGYVDVGSDNVGNLNSYTTNIYKMNFKLKFKYEDLPTLTLQYKPTQLINDATGSDYVHNTQYLWVVGANHKIPTKSLLLNTNVNYISVISLDNRNDSSEYNLEEVSLNELIYLKDLGLSINANAGFSLKTSLMEKTKILTLGLSGGYTFFDIWNNTVGLSFIKESHVNKKLSLLFSSGIPLGFFGDLSLNLDYSMYREEVFEYGDSNDLVFTGTISKSF